MFPVEDYFISTVEPIDYRPHGIFALNSTIKNDPHEALLTRAVQAANNQILFDNKLLIRILKQIYRDGTVADNEWQISQRDILSDENQIVRDENTEIAALQAMFIAFRVIVWEEKLSAEDRNNEHIQFATAGLFVKNGMRSRMNDEDICWQTIQDLLWKYEVLYSFHIEVLPLDKEIHTRVTANDLFAALLYQLLMHIRAGEAGLSGASIAYCKECGQKFIRFNTRQRYCKQCGTGSARTKRCQQRKKEGGEANAP